ncbi:MAG: arsenical pump-driving ATPase [Bdellovibrionaceae bacterium]|nr:arsenical pump-driving ATPase [Pseudobdellovibrionaceae bacterium]MDW8189556.1 ArsA-related P-loop ATPase [Pseudobdellovibrionaceae bacterium]
MRIHLVTGKGGVGKSVVSLALALKEGAASRTLLVELGEESFFQFVFDREITYHPISLTELGIDLARWSGSEALKEYVLYLIKVEKLHQLFFENIVSRSLIDAAPGLKELALLGKITSGPPRYVGPPLPYDVLVVDCFATGHFLAMLRAPMAMAETFRFGPMSEQSRSIMNVLKTPSITQIHCVTIPEELPIQETIDFLNEIKSLLSSPIKIWLNRWMQYPPVDQPGNTAEALLKKWSLAQERYWNILSGYSQAVTRLPFVFDHHVTAVAQNLVSEIAGCEA